MFYFLPICLALVQISEQQSTPESTTYIAAVVELQPSNETKADLYVEANTRTYIDIILSNETKTADILVFPEATLNKPSNAVKLPNVDENAIPCDGKEYSDVVKKISCAAKHSEKYVVINLYMERDCKEEAAITHDTRPCTRDNVNIYNTAVAFDRTGAVVAIYRKYNLFMEPQVRRTLEPDVSIFETDFGVEFGVMICFDLNLQKPAANLIKKKIENFVFPTMWFSELPFYTAAQIQQSWAYGHQVNLLAAGASNAPSTGSGIYSGRRGALKTFMADTPTTKILIAEIPKKPADSPSKNNTENDDKTILSSVQKLWKENLDKYYFHFLNFEEAKRCVGSICNGTICCEYNITVSVNDAYSERATAYYSYAVAVFDGTRTYGMETKAIVEVGTKSCSIIACKNGTDRQSCGQRFSIDSADHNKYIIEQLHLVAIMNASESFLIMPSSVRSLNLLPLKTTDFLFEEIKDDRKVRKTKKMKIQLLKPQADLLTFAILARDYTKDKWATNGSITLTGCNLLFSIALATIIYFFIKLN